MRSDARLRNWVTGRSPLPLLTAWKWLQRDEHLFGCFEAKHYRSPERLRQRASCPPPDR